MLFVIPFLVGLGDVDLFVVVSSCLMVFRLGYLLAKRRFYSKWEFFKETFNRLTWLSFNMLYAVYWVLQKMDLDPTEEGLATLLNGLGLGSVLIIVIGIGARLCSCSSTSCCGLAGRSWSWCGNAGEGTK